MAGAAPPITFPSPARRAADRVVAAEGLDSLVLDAELDGAGDVGADAVALDVVALAGGDNDALADAGDGVGHDVEAGPVRLRPTGVTPQGGCSTALPAAVRPIRLPTTWCAVGEPTLTMSTPVRHPRSGCAPPPSAPPMTAPDWPEISICSLGPGRRGRAGGVGSEEAPLDLARVEAAVREGHAGIAVLDDQAPDDDVAGRDREAGPRRRGAVDDHLEDRVQPLADGERVDEGAGLRVSVERGLGRDRRQRRRDRDRVRTAARDVECDRVVGAVRVRVEDRLAQGSCPESRCSSR